MKRIQMIMFIAILLGAVTPSWTIASPSPRYGPPLGPPPGYGDDRAHGPDRSDDDDRGNDEYQPRADVGFFYDEPSPAAEPKQKDKKGKDKKKEDPKGRLFDWEPSPPASTADGRDRSIDPAP